MPQTGRLPDSRPGLRDNPLEKVLQAECCTDIQATPGAALVLFPHVFEKLPYDPMRELKPVTKVASFHLGLAVLPDVPTFTEQGFPQLVVDGWFGAFLPGGASAEAAASLNTAIHPALREPGGWRLWRRWGCRSRPSATRRSSSR
ncbi:tripartite tricarboxylate transporter substrate-binding protein [Tepidicella baoligensis]|uniref:tripartite tricarboxylate transporter substrate-binding protein n=1 Tax=Tepidicella baoligensis TaxID=2707016 RepID=UPI0015D9F7D7|nr:tripartite tricarboxylate transporter substrate-binding protein [Tepidicella baoligensis]